VAPWAIWLGCNFISQILLRVPIYIPFYAQICHYDYTHVLYLDNFKLFQDYIVSSH
jgi:hypothetical protein